MRVQRRSLTEKLWEKTDVAGFYSRYTRLTKVSGKNELKGLCPLHEERHPSFFVNLDSGSFKCFGCGAGGGPIQFYAALHDLSVFEASARLKEEFGLGGLTSRGRGFSLPSLNNVADLSAPATGERSPAFAEIYEALLTSGRPLPEEVVKYFGSRRITRETVEQFGISYLSEPSKTAKALRKRFGKEGLAESGVFRLAESGRLRFQFHQHPLLFPIFVDGRPGFIQGRVFGQSRSRSKYCNLSGVEIPGLFNQDVLARLSPGSPIFLCEGAPDTIILEQEGFNAVGIIGSSGFKSDWVSWLSQFKVHLVLDNDEAGRKGVQKIRKLFHHQKLPVSTVTLPQGTKDVNDFFLTHHVKDFIRLLREVVEETVDLRTTVQSSLKRVMDRSDSYSYQELAEEIFTWFENNGGAFVVNDEDRCFLMFEKLVYEIGNNLRFNALMFEKTSLSHIMFQGRMVWDMLENLCFLRGRRLGDMRWIHSDESEGVIYVNLHNQDRQIARLRPGEADSMPNGTNPQSVMLTDADKMKPIEFDAGVNPKDAVRLLKTLVMDVLACEPENRLFLVCWILTAFFLDFTSERALLKLSGHTNSGKTTAARILSCLLYGADWVETGTVAYYYAEASRNPYLICDNLENENLSPDVIQFLLQVATGISKGKRQAGTDTATVRESSKALVAITAIEPLTRAELINRAYDVEFKSIFQQVGFMQREHLQKIEEARSQIFSGLFNLFAWEVLPGLQSQRTAILATLQQRHLRHSKHRVDSFLTLMVLILKALLKMLEPGGEHRTWEVVDYWISYQNRLATVTERDTNVTFFLLEALSKEMLHGREDFRKEYYLEFERCANEIGEPKEVSFVASSRDLLMAFQVLSKRKGFRLPFSNSQQLGVRLANESEVLEKSGWTWQREKVVHGMRYNRFTKRLE